MWGTSGHLLVAYAPSLAATTEGAQRFSAQPSAPDNLHWFGGNPHLSVEEAKTREVAFKRHSKDSCAIDAGMLFRQGNSRGWVFR
jgi:outer membrane receptor protein involved in Fe transport